MKNKKEKIVVIFLVVGLIVMTVAISYAAFKFTQTGSVLNQITTGSITMSYTESSNVISMTGALPTTDATGKVRLNEGEYFDFTVGSSITGTANINYEIAAQELDGNTIDGSYIKYYLTSVDSVGNETEIMSPRVYTEETSANEYTGRPSNMMSLYEGSMNASTTVKYRLRLYVDESYNPQGDGGNLVYKTRINVYGLTGEAIEESIVFAPGIYNEDGSLYMSWEELTNQYYFYAGSGFGWTHYNDNTCPGGLFNNKILVVDSSITRLNVNCFHCEEHLESAIGFSKIVIPNSVTTIDSATFSNTEVIYYSGTATNNGDWWEKEIKPYSGASELGIPTLGGVATTLEAGLYDADGNMTISWEQLTSMEYKTIVYEDGTDGTELTGSILMVENNTLVSCYDNNGTNYSAEYIVGELILSDVIEAIGSYTFESCTSLTSITIPSSVTKIYDGAFNYCTNLTEIDYLGTQAEWNDIELTVNQYGTDWNNGCSEITVHCTDGDIVIPANQ